VTGSTLYVRQVAYTNPLVLPMLAELDREYDTRYGHTLGDLAVETQRRAASPSSDRPTAA
jgi:hypothetical protein